jgi:hypothetical protein
MGARTLVCRRFGFPLGEVDHRGSEKEIFPK